MSSVEVAVTHQIKIGREDAWIKLAVAKDYGEGENIDDVIAEVEGTVNDRIFEIIENTVNTVQEYCEKEK